MQNQNQTMMIISSEFKEKESFRLIPTSIDSPYVECIFVPETKSLVVLNKQSKEEFHMLPRLNGDGEPEMKAGKAGKESHNPFKQQRVVVNLNFEYHISKENEIIYFVKSMAFNYDQKWEKLIKEYCKEEKKEVKEEETIKG